METLIQFDDFAVDPKYFVNNINRTFSALKAENERLKVERDKNKESGDVKEMLSQLLESQNSIKDDVSYVKRIYTTAKQPRTKKTTQSKAEQKSVLRMKLLNPRIKA